MPERCPNVARVLMCTDDTVCGLGCQMDLSRDMTGYSINPHTDTAKKLVTTLFYLPKDSELANAGTLVVKSLDGKIVRSGSGRSNWERMEVSSHHTMQGMSSIRSQT